MWVGHETFVELSSSDIITNDGHMIMAAFLTKKSYFNLIKKNEYIDSCFEDYKKFFRQTESVSRSIVKATCAGGRWESIPHRSGNPPSQLLLKLIFWKSARDPSKKVVEVARLCQISTDQSLLTSKVWFRTDRSKFGKVGDHDGRVIVNYPTR